MWQITWTFTPFFSTKYLNKKKKKGQSELRCIKERKLVLFASQFSWEAKRNGNKSKHKNIFTKKLTTWTRSSVHLFSRPALLEPVIFALAQDPWNNQSRPDGAHISVPALSIKNASTFPLDVWKKKESYHIKPPNPQNRIVPCPSLTLRAIISLHSLTHSHDIVIVSLWYFFSRLETQSLQSSCSFPLPSIFFLTPILSS